MVMIIITGFLFWVWMKLGKSMGSLMKKLVIFVTIFSIFPPDEEDGSVVAHDVPVALLSVELHCKPARVPEVKCVVFELVSSL